jgi:hypothetical protein
MAEKMDKLGRKITAKKRHTGYGCCFICHKEHNGNTAVRAQAVAYKTTGDKKQEYLWSKSRAMCRDCCASWIDHVEAFFNGSK